MKNARFPALVCPLFFILAFITSCSGQPEPAPAARPKNDAQIAQYVVEIFEDSKGNLWFGTIDKGVARYDGKSLVYFSAADGLCGNTVAGIAEDKEGNLWFGTHSGVSRYDGVTFTNFTQKQGLPDDRVSNILIDRTGNIWVGTWRGVCRYDGSVYSGFALPDPGIDVPSYQATANWVTEIIEDRQGNIWFARSGYGACKYDGKTFTQFTKKDGLPSNCVQAMEEDRQGNIWFGCRVAEIDHPDAGKRTGPGGLARYDGKTFTHFPDIKGLHENDVYAIHEDRAGNIWIGANRHGAYRYDGKHFTLFEETDRKDLMPYGYGIQCILKDKNGALWLGLSGGLFRLENSTIMNVTQAGPWK